jgi:Ca-activated chloride channel family protein
MPVEIDEGILRQIAQMTDGKYFRATDNAKLQQVYTEIDKLEKSRIDVRQFRIREEKYMIYAVIAFALIMLEIVLRNTLFKNLN